MQQVIRAQRTTLAILMVLVGILAISINDMLFKFLSGGYPLHELVFVRSAIGILFSLVIVQLEGGWSILRTKTPGLHVLRVSMVVIANMSFFAALAALPLAEATAIFFVAPLMITLLSIPILGERVGPARLTAVLIGFVGVIIMTRPWETDATRETSFWVYLLPIIAATTYSLNQILTRLLGVAAKASAMAIYTQMAFIFVSLLFYAVAGDGRYAQGFENESLVFLLRAWQWPEQSDIYLFIAVGVNSALVGYCLAQAYRLADAATVAPFEYVGLPLAVFWGWLVWRELPTPIVTAGICLILGSGLFVFIRERIKNRQPRARKTVGRRF